jgi:hypothetical protein
VQIVEEILGEAQEKPPIFSIVGHYALPVMNAQVALRRFSKRSTVLESESIDATIGT